MKNENKINVQAEAKLGGSYNIEVKNTETGEIKHYEFDNLIVDTGLDIAGTGFGGVDYLYVGTGNTAPTNNDSSLQAQLSTGVLNSANWTGSFTAQAGATPPYYTAVKTWTIPQNTRNGIWAEVGTGTTSAGTGTALFSRSLIKDINGTPITITVTALDQVTITYSVRLYMPISTTGNVSTVVMNGTTYTINSRIKYASSSLATYLFEPLQNTYAFVYAYNGVTNLGATFTDPLTYSGTQLGVGGRTRVVQAYTAGDKKRTLTYNFLVSDMVKENINGLILGSSNAPSPTNGDLCGVMMMISPAFTKLNTQTFSITYTVSWDRY